MIAGLAYTYAPYHLLNLYVRANLAESMAFVWLPLCLWAARESVVRPAYRWVVALAVSYAGLMLTSNLVVVLFTPLLARYVLLLTVVPVSYTHLTLPASDLVENSVVAGSLKKKKASNTRYAPDELQKRNMTT